MDGKKMRELERQIDCVFGLCEKLLLRTLLIGCLVIEVGKFAKWLLR